MAWDRPRFKAWITPDPALAHVQVQVAGAGWLGATESNNTDPGVIPNIKPPSDVLIAGLAVQTFSFAVFFLIYILVCLKLRRLRWAPAWPRSSIHVRRSGLGCWPRREVGQDVTLAASDTPALSSSSMVCAACPPPLAAPSVLPSSALRCPQDKGPAGRPAPAHGAEQPAAGGPGRRCGPGGGVHPPHVPQRQPSAALSRTAVCYPCTGNAELVPGRLRDPACTLTPARPQIRTIFRLVEAAVGELPCPAPQHAHLSPG